MHVRSKIRTNLFILYFSLSATQLVAQSSAADSVFYTEAVNNAVAGYYRSSGDQSRLYNGTQYVGSPYTFSEGTPFFLSDKGKTGSVVYDGILYKDISLEYDELMDVLIMEDTIHRIQLSNERISGFTISDFRFTRIVKNSLNKSIPATGFYHVLYEGNLGVLKKEIKTVREVTGYSARERTYIIDSRPHYYFSKKGVHYEIGGKKDLLDLLNDHKKEIQSFIRSNRLKYKKNADDLFVKVAVYYDQLAK